MPLIIGDKPHRASRDLAPTEGALTRAPFTISDLCWTDLDDDPGARVILGTAWVLGIAHHVWFIEVMDDVTGCQGAVRDPCDRFGDCLTSDGRVQTVNLPGQTGDWAMFIEPYAG